MRNYSRKEKSHRVLLLGKSAKFGFCIQLPPPPVSLTHGTHGLAAAWPSSRLEEISGNSSLQYASDTEEFLRRIHLLFKQLLSQNTR
jgi:hypothetical protein